MTYSSAIREVHGSQLSSMREQGLIKEERYIHSPQSANIDVEFPSGSELKSVINLCANNYLGLSSHPDVIQAAHKALDDRGYGLSSVRFICGTQDIHRELEGAISQFLGTEDTILFPSCMDANAGVFEAFLEPDDVIISDRLVHASIVDGIRLCKAVTDTYKHANMKHLEQKLEEHQDKRVRLVVTDGVFSMDGDLAPLDEICALAEKYDAMVMVDECHSAGVVGETGRGVTELFNIRGKVDIITGTLGKAFGGAIGGFTTGRKEIIEMLRQRSRPYLFSNSIPPAVVGAGIRMFDMMDETSELQELLHHNTSYFNAKMQEAGFDIKPTQSAICAVMLYDAKLSQEFASRLLDEGIYVIGFYFPVVPREQARIRVQLSAAHTQEHLDRAIKGFTKVGKALGVIG